VVKGDKYTVTVGKAVDRGNVKLNPSAKPQTLDITGTEGPNKGRTILAIYERDGDTLRVCYDLSGKNRPTEFKTKEGTTCSSSRTSVRNLEFHACSRERASGARVETPRSANVFDRGPAPRPHARPCKLALIEHADPCTPMSYIVFPVCKRARPFCKLADLANLTADDPVARSV